MNANSLPGFNHSIYKYNFTEKQMRYYFEPPPRRPIKKLLFTAILYSFLALVAIVVLIFETPILVSFIQTRAPASSNSFLIPGSMLIMLIILTVCGWKGY